MAWSPSGVQSIVFSHPLAPVCVDFYYLLQVCIDGYGSVLDAGVLPTYMGPGVECSHTNIHMFRLFWSPFM